MVFPSVPVYLDPPNWQQQAGAAAAGSEIPPFPPQQPLPPPGGGGGGSRPGSMADKARVAKVPQPETALKCPRCESTNTKFCYFNNYSLTQPRHFCKTCRRYWTRGGALRNVPVGGGCRRNKRSKGSNGSRSRSPAGAAGGSSSSSTGLASNSCTTDIRAHIPSLPSQLPMFPPLHHLGDYNVPNIALSFNGVNPPTGATAAATEFQIGSTSSNGGNDGGGVGGSGSILASGLVEPWRMQQQAQLFPFLSNFETVLNRHYPFETEGFVPANYVGGQLRSNKPLDAGVNQHSSVKMEENQRLDLSRNSSGVSENRNDQFWGGNAWSDLPGFASSSTTSHLF